MTRARTANEHVNAVVDWVPSPVTTSGPFAGVPPFIKDNEDVAGVPSRQGSSAVPASEARSRLFPLIEQVNEDQEPIEIVSKKGTAFLVSEAQFRSMTETAYLMRSPANAERLLTGVTQVDQGTFLEHELMTG